jgi:hypothetical protein
MSLLSRKRLLRSKIESVYGTDPTPAGTDAVLVRSLEITPLNADVVERELIRPYLGNFEQLLGNQNVEVTFEVELAGSGTAGTAPAWGPIMRACGMAETIVASTSVAYAPVSSSFESCTLYFDNDGILHKITGCRGTFSMSAEVNAIPVLNFTMTGIYNAPTDTAVPTATYSNQAAPLLFRTGNTSSFSIFGYSGILQSVNFDIANETIYRELIGGSKEVLITDRKPAGEVMVEAVSLATHDFFTDATGTSTGGLSFTHGTAAGNIVAFSSPQTDLGAPSYSDQDGIQMISLPYTSTPTSSGNDEVSLTLT